jgi:cell division septation protein DedD
MGRRQVAAVALLMVVLLAVCCGGSYLIGRSVQSKALPQQPVTVPAAPPVDTPAAAPPAANANPAPSAAVTQAVAASAQPVSEAGAKSAGAPPAVSRSATAIVQPAAQSSAGAASQAPLFADPVPGAIYIQTGAVEKGVAAVIAEGLRTHGLNSFVAPGPSGKIFRVLIGPFHDEQAYKQARKTVDSIDLQNFARSYQP